MITLPPGCTVSQNIRIVIDELTDDMLQWFVDVGGAVTTDHQMAYPRNSFGYGKMQPEKFVKRVSYGRGKYCYRMQDGSQNILLHFQGEDGAVASAFILRFNESILSHNFPEFTNEHA
jgi:hypothetical protein